MLALADVDRLDPSQAVFDGVFWLALIVGLFFVAFVIAWIVRAKSNRAKSQAPAGFTLHDLRVLQERGEITKAEFDRLRNKAIARPETQQKSMAESS